MKKFNYNRIIDFFVLFAFAYIPDYILSGKLDTIYDYYSLIVFLCIIIYYLIKRKFSISKIIILIGIMQLIPLITTVTYGDHLMFKRGVRILIGSVSLACLVDYNISFRKKDFLKSVIFFWGSLVVLNILSFFIFFPSMDVNQLNFYFLGNDNGSIYETFTFIFVALVYFSLYAKKIPLYFYILLMFIFAGYFYVKSGNGILCMLITIVFILLYKLSFVKKILTPKLLIPIYIFLFFMIVIIRDNNFFMQTLLDLFGKSQTISGRTYIWDQSIYYFAQHPLIGNGYESEAIAMAKFGNVKAHNVILQYLYTGGVATLGLFLTFVGIVLNRIKKSNVNINLKTIMNFSIFLFFVISMFDFYMVKFTTFLMLTIYYFLLCDSIPSEEKKKVGYISKIKNKLKTSKFYKGLFKNSFWAFAGDSSAAVINLIIIIVLIKLIGDDNLGILVLTQTYMQIVDVILNVQAWKSVIQYGQKAIVEKSKKKLLSYIKLGVRIDVITAIIGGAVAIFIAPLVGNILNWSQEAILCAEIFSITIFSHLSGTSTALLRIFDKFHLVALQKFLTAVIKLGSLLFLFLYFDKVSLLTATIVYCATDIIGNLLLVMFAIITYKRKYKISELFKAPTPKDAKSFLSFTLWSTIGDITDIPVNYLDMFIISLLGTKMVAVFKVFKQCIAVLKKVTSAIQQAIMPQFSELVASKKKLQAFNIVKKIRDVILKVMIPVGLIIGFTSPLWLKVLYGKLYAENWYILLIYLLIQIVALSFTALHPLYISLNKVKEDALIAFVSNVVYLIVSYLLVSRLGMLGIVIAFAIQSSLIISIKYNETEKIIFKGVK